MFREEGELLQHIATCDMIQRLLQNITNGIFFSNIITFAQVFVWGALAVLGLRERPNLALIERSIPPVP